MRTRKRHRLKDILINHVFDYCYNEVVKKFESEGFKFSSDGPEGFKDPSIQTLIEHSLKKGNSKFYHGTRDSEYCKILVEKDVTQKALIDKLLHQGFRKGKKLYKHIENAHSFLIVNSYFAQNYHDKNEIRLTEKGLRHYLEGKSFEQTYLIHRNSNIALILSIISIMVATIAVIITWNIAKTD